MTRLLLTGGRGFIGSHLVRLLAGAGTGGEIETYLLVRPGRRPPAQAQAGSEGGVTVIDCDLTEPDQVRRAVGAVRPNAAIHLAWQLEPGSWKSDVRGHLTSLEAGVRLVRELLDAGCERVVLAGTGVERLDGARWHERQPDSTYAAAKGALHGLAAQLAATGAGVVCAHVYYLFGPGEHEHRLVPLVVNRLLRGEAVDVTDGRQERDYLYVEDVASALLAVTRSDLLGTVDVASGVPTAVGSLLSALATEAGRPELLRLGARPYADDELLYHVGDATALAGIGWQPSHDLASAARATVDWWRARGPGSPTPRR